MATNQSEIVPTSPAISVEFSGGVYTVTREGKGDSLSFARANLIRRGWTPVTGTSIRYQVTLWWDWANDIAYTKDQHGRRSEYGTISEVVEELAFLHLS